MKELYVMRVQLRLPAGDTRMQRVKSGLCENKSLAA
jgi:hypothetical protein